MFLPLLTLQLFLYTTIKVIEATPFFICARLNNMQDEVIVCEVSKTNYVCLVCPIASNKKGLMWQDSNNTVIFRENVRTDKRNVSFAVNNCHQNNYTMSFTSTESKDKNPFVCLAGDKPLLTFFVNVKDREGSNRVLCSQLHKNDQKIACGTFANSSVCLVCPISRHTPGISWQHNHNTLFQNDVSTSRQESSLTVNKCEREDYTLSFGNLSNEDQGIYSCYYNERKLTDFFVYNKAFPEITLSCETGQTRCDLNVRCGLLLNLQCTITNSRAPFTVIWLVDDVIVKEDTHASVSRGQSFKTGMEHISNGTERNLTCQVREESLTTGSKTLYFVPVREDSPSLQIFWGKKFVQNAITLNKNETTLLSCVATNVTIPKELYWEIDNQRIYNGSNVRKNGCDIENKLEFLPQRAKHNMSCVYTGSSLHDIRSNVILFSTHHSGEDNRIPVFLPIVLITGVVLVILSISLLYGFLKGKVFVCALHQSRFREMLTKKTNSNAVYYEMEVGEESAYVRLRTRISSNGRLERWVGDLTDMTTDRTCMVNACKEGITETEYKEFRKLAMVLKDMRRHVNIVEVIAIQVEKGPYMIYTEFIEGVTLKHHLIQQSRHLTHTSRNISQRLKRFAFEVLSAMLHLKSFGLAHPGIRCQKVLMTESLICKIYDFCIYPATEDIITRMLQQNNNSVMPWLAQETRIHRTHTFESDAFSSAVFIWELFSLGKDPSHSIYMVPVDCNEEFLPKPELCHQSLYLTMQRCWSTDASGRPALATVQNELAICMDDIRC